MAEHAHKSRYTFLIYVMLVVAVVVAYEPMRHNDFISYDDPHYVTKNPHITDGLTAESVIWAFTSIHCLNYHPLTSLSHMLDCKLFGLNPFWHHADSLLFHTLNTLLLFWILKRMTGSVWASAFIAALFAVHPLQVESVAWASERKNVLSGFFWILTMAAYVRYSKRPTLGRYMPVIVVYTLALLSKPMVVTLPFVLLLLDYWPLQRLRQKPAKNSDSVKPQYQQFSAGRLIMEKLPLLILSATLGVITLIAQRGGGIVSSLERIPIRFRIANACIAYLKYIEKFIWPHKLALLYPHPGDRISMVAVAVCALMLLLISAKCIQLGRQNRYLIVGWLWFVGTLVPVIGIVQVGGQAMADRYMYIPMIGLLIIITWAACETVAQSRYRTILVTLSAIAVLSAALIYTRRQVGYWKNSFTLFEHTLEVTSDNPIIHNSCACALCDAGRFDDAMIHFRKAVEITPAFSTARYNLGKLLFAEGKFDEAIACFQRLVKTNQYSAEAYYYLGLVCAKKNDPNQAVRYFSEALRIDPNHIEAGNILAKVSLLTGQLDKAIECFNGILRADPKRADVHTNLGTVYMKKGRLDLAASSWSRAVELKPDSAPVLNNLAWLLAATRDSNLRNPAKAVEFALRACELTGYGYPSVLDTLAVAYAADGRFSEAIQTAEQAKNLAELTNQKELTKKIQERLNLYRAKKPYYDK